MNCAFTVLWGLLQEVHIQVCALARKWLLTDFSETFQSIDQAVEMIRHFLSEII